MSFGRPKSLRWSGIAVSASLLATVVACSSNLEADGTDEGAATAASGLSYVGQHVVDVLSTEQHDQRGVTWNVSHDNVLPSDFVVQFPPVETWGDDTLSVAARCTEGADCNVDFGLFKCSTDADCNGHGKCTALKATLRSANEAPQPMCVGHSDAVLDRIWSAIALAKTSVDLSSLTPPDGRFQAAVRNAVTYASSVASPPRIRMMFGNYPGSTMTTRDTLATLTRDVAKESKLDIAVGTYISGLESWNHSKTIVTDGRVGLLGGANMWDDHYLAKDPVHDMWMTVNGTAAADVTRFLDPLWTYACRIGPNGSAMRIPTASGCPDPLPRAANDSNDATGGVSIIAAGRHGAIGANPSDRALIAMVESAKHTVRLSQQDIGPIKRAGLSLGAWPEDLMVAMLAAMARGVDVSFILTNTDAVPGNVSALAATFNTYDNGWTLPEIGAKFIAIGAAHPDVLAGVDAATLVCTKLKLMHLRSSASETWADGRPLANHVKTIVIDDQAFYVGSQNSYVANLAEFGLIVDDANAARKFISDYLDRAESYSKRTTVGGSTSACAFVSR